MNSQLEQSSASCMSQHHGHNIRRSDSFLTKSRCGCVAESILRSNTAIQVITGGPRHRFHCDAAQTHRDTELWKHARIPCPNAKRITFAAHVRAKTRQKRVPRVPFMRYLKCKHAQYADTRAHGRRGRARLPPNGRTPLAADAGRERRTPRRSQVIVSRIHR